MKIPPSKPDTPALSNYLASLAVDVANDVAAYRRSSLEAHRAYLSAAAKLVEARGECTRRGQWGAFLTAAGLERRTAGNMMQLARAGITAERVSELGGVQAALDALRAAAAGAVDVAADVLDAGAGGGEIAELDSGNDVGEERPDVPSVAGEAGFGWRQDADTRGEAAPVLGAVSGSDRPVRTTARQGRRARGECADCGAVSLDAYRCPSCAAKHRASTSKTSTLARRWREAAPVLEAAAAEGRGLSAEDVAGLVRGNKGARR